MRTIIIEPSFRAWREKARELLAEMVEPNQIIWGTGELYCDQEEGSSGLLDFGEKQQESETAAARKSGSPLRVTKQFVRLAETVSSHRSRKQWAMLYEILWKMTYGNDRHILQNQTNPTMRGLEKMRASVSRDIHKMRAFVRFRKVALEHDDESAREYFVAWFEPDHLIVRLNAAFFRKRFGGMSFSILTPDECMHWNGVTVNFTAGVHQSQAPDMDELETLWKGYYRSIFNPARVKIKMMQTEMPKKYWKNLPEAEIIDELIRDSTDRVNGMMEEPNRELKPKPTSIDADEWVAMLDQTPGKPDPAAGRRLYFHPRLALCATCHEMDGRGRLVGPNLSTIHQQLENPQLLKTTSEIAGNYVMERVGATSIIMDRVCIKSDPNML